MSTIVKARRQSGKNTRKDEPVISWENYFRISCKHAHKYLAYYFPTRDDLSQAAALAASEAYAQLGEETTFVQLIPIIRSVLKQQASAYGMKQREITKPDGRKTMQTIRREINFSSLPQDERGQPLILKDTRLQLVAMSEWSRKVARFLAEL